MSSFYPLMTFIFAATLTLRMLRMQMPSHTLVLCLSWARVVPLLYMYEVQNRN
eukprot:gene8439-10744_t